MNNSEITIKFIEPTEEQEREYEEIRNLVNSWLHLISIDQDTSKFCNRFKESLSNLKYHKITELDLSDLVTEVTNERLSDSHPIIVNQVVEGDFKCSRCKKPSHTGVWGKDYPQPCFWCKGEYVYPGSKTANDCNDFELIEDSWYGDTRPVLC